MSRIPEAFLEDLLNRVDVVDVIQRRVPLKRAGSEWKACCPFHDEKTPSFTVSPKKQFYHCFGCGAHGSAITFLMNYEGLDFRDAVEELAHDAGLEVPVEASSAPRVEPGVYDVLAEAARFYQQRLRESEAAIAYLKGRGLGGEVCRDYAIGYAPDAWDALIKALGSGDSRAALLRRAGLLSQGQHGDYDKFRHRIMFPIHDRRGRVIAFGGRIIAADDGGPKYLNSPETEVFHKGRELYGLHHARRRQGTLEQVVVVEGYTDVVGLAQAGISNAVATLGTATTPHHAELLFRAAEEVLYCFDGDEAGRKAAWRAVESTLPKMREGREVRFLFLPEGEDPDSLVQAGGVAAFEDAIARSVPLSTFFFDHVSAGLDLGSIDGRARLVDQARPLLEQIPPGVFHDMMLEQLETLARHRLDGPRPASRLPPDRQPSGWTPVRLAMAHLVQNPALGVQVEALTDLDGCTVAGAELLVELVEYVADRPHLTTAQLLELWYDHPANPHLRKLAQAELRGQDEQQAREFQDAFCGVRLQCVEERLKGMPRIIEQTPEQRETFRNLQQRRETLKNALRGQLD